MVESRDEPDKLNMLNIKRHRFAVEETWVRGFLEHSGTENITRFCPQDMIGVSLTRACEALSLGTCVYSDKCEGSGAICTFEHESEDDIVEVTVVFVAAEETLEILKARVKENDSEPNAA